MQGLVAAIALLALYGGLRLAVTDAVGLLRWTGRLVGLGRQAQESPDDRALPRRHGDPITDGHRHTDPEPVAQLVHSGRHIDGDPDIGTGER